jgi:hypothetical protein
MKAINNIIVIIKEREFRDITSRFVEPPAPLFELPFKRFTITHWFF